MDNKNEQVNKYALMLSDIKDEKKELQLKLEKSQKEIKMWINGFYLVVILFLIILFIIIL
jgi:hypothetical protein